MNETRWQKWGAASGIPFVALVIAGGFVMGEPPAADAQIPEIRQFLTDHQDQYRLSAVLTMLGAFFGLWFLGAVYNHIRRSEATGSRISVVTFGAGIATITLALGASASMLGIMYYGGTQAADDGMIRAFWNMSTVAYVPLAATTAAFAGSIAMSVFERSSMAQWVGWVAVLTMVINLISIFGVMNDDLDAAMPMGIAAFTSAMVLNLCLAAAAWKGAGATAMAPGGRTTTA